MRPAFRAPLAAAACLALFGCGALDPFPTAPSPPLPGAKTAAAKAPRVAICYDRLTTSLAEVRQEAQKQCPAGTYATPADTDWLLGFCPLLLPARATFACNAAK